MNRKERRRKAALAEAARRAQGRQLARILRSQNERLYPTHECFDDIPRFFNELFDRGAPIDELDRFTIVHGICLKPPVGEPYAHGWIERDGFVIQAGIYKSRRIYYRMRRDAYLAARVVWDETRYSFCETAAYDAAGILPPYRKEYRALCADLQPTPSPGPRQWPVAVVTNIEAAEDPRAFVT